MKAIALLSLPLFFAHGWTSIQHSSSRNFKLHVKTSESKESENPCWQDLYDDDCGMDSVYSASFVAKNWIKSMPCAQGLEDCDYPEELKQPGALPHAGVDEVDVMKFLNLKRADAVDKKKDDDKSDVAP